MWTKLPSLSVQHLVLEAQSLGKAKILLRFGVILVVAFLRGRGDHNKWCRQESFLHLIINQVYIFSWWRAMLGLSWSASATFAGTLTSPRWPSYCPGSTTPSPSALAPWLILTGGCWESPLLSKYHAHAFRKLVSGFIRLFATPRLWLVWTVDPHQHMTHYHPLSLRNSIRRKQLRLALLGIASQLLQDIRLPVLLGVF